jgi:hypothetical protein
VETAFAFKEKEKETENGTFERTVALQVLNESNY